MCMMSSIYFPVRLDACHLDTTECITAGPLRNKAPVSCVDEQLTQRHCASISMYRCWTFHAKCLSGERRCAQLVPAKAACNVWVQVRLRHSAIPVSISRPKGYRSLDLKGCSKTPYTFVSHVTSVSDRKARLAQAPQALLLLERSVLVP